MSKQAKKPPKSMNIKRKTFDLKMNRVFIYFLILLTKPKNCVLAEYVYHDN